MGKRLLSFGLAGLMVAALNSCGGGGGGGGGSTTSSAVATSSSLTAMSSSSRAPVSSSSLSSVLSSASSVASSSSLASSITPTSSSSAAVSSSSSSSSLAAVISSASSTAVSSSSLTSSSPAASSSSSLSSASAVASSSSSAPGISSASSSSSSSTANTLSGTAAIGAPIAGSVVAIDVNGLVSPAATTSGLGAFTVDVTGMTAPFILTIHGTANGSQVTLSSIATAVGQTVNVTPLTDLVVSLAAAAPGGVALADLCQPVDGDVSLACLAVLNKAGNSSNLNAAVTSVMSMVASLNTNNTNPLTASFVADGTGMDALLDKILVAPAINLGATATITLVGTNAALGSVALPVSSEGTATPTTNTVSESQLQAANAAITGLGEINSCLSSLNGLYPAKNFVVPSAGQVGNFIDETFSASTIDKQGFIGLLTDEVDGIGRPGLTFAGVSVASLDMSPLSAAEITSYSQSSVSVINMIKARSTTGFDVVSGVAWVKLAINDDASSGAWKFIKGAAYEGCSSGWRIAGFQHLDMHMMPRLTHDNDDDSMVREWSFHVEVEELESLNTAVDKIEVSGPGLSAYAGKSTPVGAAKKVSLFKPSGLYPTMVIDNGTSFYGNGDSLRSCQDLASTNAPVGTTCVDETKVQPGQYYNWVLKDSAHSTVINAFAFQTTAVPLSIAFAKANKNSLLATITSITPANLNSVSAYVIEATADQDNKVSFDGVFKFTYTQQQDVYGSRMDNCGVNLYSNGELVLNAEQDATGAESSCTFTTSGLNFGSLLIDQNQSFNAGGIYVSTSVLGNQVSNRQSYPNPK